MNICSSCRKTICHNSPNDQNKCKCSTIKGTSVDHLGDILDKIFFYEEAETVTDVCIPPLDGDYMGHVGNETSTVLEVHESESTSSAAQNCLFKCETFPCRKPSSWSASSDEEEEAGCDFLAYSCIECSNTATQSISLPAPLELVSALKGSREKQGMESKKLTVTWAPDVYDPLPSSLSPLVKNKMQQKSKIKENGKNKQKGTQGGIGKDKKQFRKISDLCLKKLDARNRLVYDDVTNYDDEVEDFDVGSPDSYCESSFFEKLLGKAHMSVADFIDY